MSSSSQTANPNGYTNTFLQNKSNSFVFYDDYAREETILEKQTVRITTPPSAADGPRSTLILDKRKENGYGNVHAPDSCLQRREIREIQPLLGNQAHTVNRLDSRNQLVDKACQTDDLPPQQQQQQQSNNKKSSIMEESAGDYSAHVLGSEITHQLPQTDDVDNINTINADVKETEKDNESKDRDLEHVDVIVNDSRFVPETTDEDVQTIENDPYKQNGSIIELDGKDDRIVYTKEPMHIIKEEEEDSCCINCLYVSMNLCECVIL